VSLTDWFRARSIKRQLEAIEETIPVCAEHGRSTDDHSWAVNTYVCDPERDPDHLEWILYGWHDLEFWDERGRFPLICIAARVHTVPAGAVLYDLT
jgi:hypothetical protein